MLRKPLALLLAVGFVFALAACGDDSGSATATTSGSSGSAPAASSGGAGTSSGSGSAGTTAAPNFSGSGSKEFCAQAKGFQDTFGQNADFGQSSDPAQLKDDFSKAEDALKQLESSAPDEIKADVKTVSESLSSLISVFESANYDFTKLAQDPAALAKLESFDSQEVQDASTRIEAYFSQVCGISTTDTTP
jgi:hypothetical protein